MAETLPNLKKTRAALQGHLTRHSRRFDTHNVNMDFVALQAMLRSIEDLEQRFLITEEKVVLLENPDNPEDPGEIPDEIPPSPAFEKFMDDYDALKGQILTLMEIKRPKPGADTSGNGQPHRSRPIRLPKLQIPHFSGNVTDWTDFKNEFLSLVNDEDLTDVDRFRFLKSALGEVPKRIISSMEVTEENYKKAWDALVERFDNKSVIFRAHINEFLRLQGASGDSVGRYRELLDKSRAHYRALTSLGTIENLAENLMICVLLQKLDAKAQAKWEEYTDETIATWDEFTTFFEKYASTMEKVQQTKQQTSSKPSGSGKQMHTTLLSGSNATGCKKCNAGSHTLRDCPSFLELTPRARCNEAKRLSLCLKCLTSDHSFRNCKAKCGKCGKGHNFLLHYDVIEQPPQSNQSSGASSSPTVQTPPSQTSHGNPQATSTPTSGQALLVAHGLDDTALVGSVMVDVFDDSGNRIPVHALLDSGSTTHIVSEKIARLVNATILKKGSSIGGVGATCTKVTGLCSLKIGSRFSDNTYEFYASAMPRVSGPYPSSPFDISDWNIPSYATLTNPDFNKPQKVDLLIGAGLFWKLLRPQRHVLGPDLPILQETDLGWIVVGPMASFSNPQSTLTAIESTDEALDLLVRRFWEIDTLPGDDDGKLSSSDRFCEDFFLSSTRRDDSGRYIVRLPFRGDAPSLGTSYQVARQRFLNLERKLHKDPVVKQMYSDFIDEYERLGHLERVQSVVIFTKPHYFIPHHCVLKPTSSTTKLRVVFDASCKTSNGLSLNDILRPGPKIQEDLFVILMRFRLFKYVATADIQKMYRQILVDRSDTDFQLILWRKDPSEPIEILRLLTVTYGTAPGAFLSIRALHQLAHDEAQRFPKGSELLLKNFYVDDALIGANTISELENALDELHGILKLGGFALGKHCSNAVQIVERFPPELREKYLCINDHNIIRTLGLLWEPESDSFRYSADVCEVKEPTKRLVLSQIARLFDPLGFICPVVTLAKCFYQDLWKLKLDWDEPLPLELQGRWNKFTEQLSGLKHVSIPRYALHESNPIRIELHGFSDASEKAYGACLYLRCVHDDDSITTRLLCAKSRVAPAKTVSIARLELCAAKMLVDLKDRVRREVLNDIHIDQEYLWTDSTIVLSWLSSEPHRWSTFVAHRVTKIQERTALTDWRHVPGPQNPADLVSRGLYPADLAASSLWWNGSRFLYDAAEPWPAEFARDVPLDLVEEARATKFALLTVNRSDVTDTMHFSTGFRGTRRAFAYALRFIENCRRPREPKEARKLKLESFDYESIAIPDVQEELRAEEFFIRSIQRAAFPDEISELQRNRPVPRKSPLIQLAPFFDNGLLRVGGRVPNAKLPFDAKHQILLPGDHPFTNVLVSFYHHYRVFHAGPQTTLTAIRARYWPIRGTVLARRVAFNCVWCFRMRPRFMTQLMGDLPEDRVNPREWRPFSVTGVDFAGPFIVRHHIRCKQQKKVYLVLFICMTSKAVHADLVTDLSTDAFLRALRRFVSDRGSVSKVCSDNGTNFVGAANHLREVTKMLSDGQGDINKACRELHIEWSFSPPRTPHFGGLWEASIKLLKRLMLGIAGDLNLTEDELRTVAKQASAVINSRPITTVSSNPNDLEPLTPGHFIYGGPASAIPEPPAMIKNDDINLVHVARRMVVANQQLWKRFFKEYLALLQPRSKWFIRNGKFTPGSLVLLKEDNVPSLKWPLGRIVKTFPSPDGTIRVVEVKTNKGTFKRGVTGVALLPDESQPNSLHGGEDVQARVFYALNKQVV